MGSGKLIKRAIRLYGVGNFKREILFSFESEQEAKTKERELVNAEFILETTNYNLALGGFGGGMIGDTNPFYGKKHSKEVLERLSMLGKTRTHTIETKKKISDSLNKSESFKSSFNAERSKKISDAHKKNSKLKPIIEKIVLPRKKVRNWWTATKVNKNPEKIRKMGRPKSDECKANISKALIGKYSGEKSGNFKGWYHTPYGKFTSLNQAATSIGNSIICVRDRCVVKNGNVVTITSVNTDIKITKEMLGKTWKELGWYFEEKV
jgi:hypothetical protein